MKNSYKMREKTTTVSITVTAAEVLAKRARKAGCSKQQFLSLLLLDSERDWHEGMAQIEKRIDGIAKLIRAIERDKLDASLEKLGQTADAVNSIAKYCRQSDTAIRTIIKEGMKK